MLRILSIRKSILIFGLLVLVGFSFRAIECKQQTIEVVKFDWFEKQRTVQNDTTYVFNFWATWCVPCVAELPEFEKLQKKYEKEKVKVVLISLDNIKTITDKLIPFVQKNKIQSKVVLLNDSNYNAWIDKVDSTWSGALPATLVFNNAKKQSTFLEKGLTFTELDSLVHLIK